MRNRVLAFALLLILPGCIPEPTRVDDTYVSQETQIDTVRISWATDTVSVSDPWNGRIVAIYRTGSQECFSFDTSALTRVADTFFVRIWEKAYTNRICLATQVKEYQELTIAEPLLPGKYWFVAGDSVKGWFVVTE